MHSVTLSMGKISRDLASIYRRIKSDPEQHLAEYIGMDLDSISQEGNAILNHRFKEKYDFQWLDCEFLGKRASEITVEVHKKFISYVDLLTEVYLTTMDAKKGTADAEDRNFIKQNLTVVHIGHEEQQIEKLRREHAELHNWTEQIYQKYEEALSKLPTGAWAQIMDVVCLYVIYLSYQHFASPSIKRLIWRFQKNYF